MHAAPCHCPPPGGGVGRRDPGPDGTHRARGANAAVFFLNFGSWQACRASPEPAGRRPGRAVPGAGSSEVPRDRIAARPSEPRRLAGGPKA
eukprot:541317-Hanusia_phi.AAC.2